MTKWSDSDEENDRDVPLAGGSGWNSSGTNRNSGWRSSKVSFSKKE